MGVFLQVVNVLANVLSVLTSMSPIPTLVVAWKQKDLGEISLLPLASMNVNCFLWLMYGVLSDKIFPLVTTYAIGQTLCVSYVIVYLLLTPNKKRSAFITAVAVAVIALISIYIGLARSGVTNQSDDSIASVIGVLADIFSILMYVSPFETIVRILRIKNASSLPIHLCFVGAVNNTVWLLYGCLTNDFVIIASNTVCTLVCWIQVAVYVIYRPGRHVGDPIGVKTITSPVVDMAIVVESPKSPVVYSGLASPAKAV